MRSEDGSLVGSLGRDAILAEPGWRSRFDGTEASSGAERLRDPAGSGAEVTIVLGTWCGDSKRELSQFFRDVDAVGGRAALPFRVRLIGVDKRKAARPVDDIADWRIAFVPTFVVRRAGEEIGRIVESPPHDRTLADALADLLAGDATGILSGRDVPR